MLLFLIPYTGTNWKTIEVQRESSRDEEEEKCRTDQGAKGKIHGMELIFFFLSSVGWERERRSHHLMHSLRTLDSSAVVELQLPLAFTSIVNGWGKDHGGSSPAIFKGLHIPHFSPSFVAFIIYIKKDISRFFYNFWSMCFGLQAKTGTVSVEISLSHRY